jgi:hypothetical protein
MTPKSARLLFGAALVVYFLWVAALATMAVVSASRPGDARSRLIPAPAASPSDANSPKS